MSQLILLPIVARHGIPDPQVSDNGQPFSSAKFQEFAKSYGFEHVTSSPAYPQSNWKAENAVKTVKNLLAKAVKSEQDPYLVLLDWRNTPTETLNSSPVQQLFGRRTKTRLPTSNQLLKPKLPEEVSQKLKLQKTKESLYYNKGAKELEELCPGDIVWLQPLTSQIGKDWTQARVTGKVDITSYQVRTEDGRLYRRNWRHLRHTHEVTCNSDPGTKLPPRLLPRPTTANANTIWCHLPHQVPMSAQIRTTQPQCRQTSHKQTTQLGPHTVSRHAHHHWWQHDVDELSDQHHVTSDRLSIRKDTSNFKKKKKRKIFCLRYKTVTFSLSFA